MTAKAAAIDAADAEAKRWEGEVARAVILLKQRVYDQGTYDQDVNQWKSSLAKVAEARANSVRHRPISLGLMRRPPRPTRT